MSYSKYYEINKHFQSSINLELDLDNENKIYEYVPTTDICDVLKKYVKSALGKSKERATTLIGPYGKGKSFLLLILSFIFSKNKDNKVWNDLAAKIKKVDEELYSLMVDIKKKNISLIPVLINSNYDNIEQSFMMALSDALKRNKLDAITPKTAYFEALQILKTWEKDKTISNDLLTQCIKKANVELEEIKKGLNVFSKEMYEKFCDVYFCITRGVKFNPFISNEISRIFFDVSMQVTKYGYSGLFIIFDEFSKYIESTTADVSKGLKIIQDLAEKCTRTDLTPQLHICCVAHKTISLYKDNKKDSFKAVEGRFTEIRFNRSLEENYQIISAAIIHKKDSDKIAKKYFDENIEFYKSIDELEIFNDQRKTYLEAFPLNPLTTYTLIQLSELVAQNERTLYTFLSDTDDNSFNSFLHEKEKGLFNIDKIYDYFSELLQKEETNYIRNVWYRTETILSKLDSPLDKKIVKALAIILMINDFDKLPPNVEIISLSINEDLKTTETAVNSLIDKKYLRNNIVNNLLSFALSNTKHIDDKISILKKTKFKNFNSSEFCNTINDKKYLIPRRHNAVRKITRFYKTIFLTEEEFLGLANFDIFFDRYYCDGIVIYLLRYKLDESIIIEKVNQINNERVVVCYPNKIINNILDKELLRYACLKDIENQGSIDELTGQEISLLLEETVNDIQILLGKYFDENVKIAHCNIETNNLPELLSEILDNYYTEELIFNNELINKRTVSTQYQKAVNNIVDCLLDARKDFDFSPTSPEASVKYAVLDYNNENKSFRKVLDLIKEKILSCEGKKYDFNTLFSFLSLKPYGIRDGVIPVLIAKAISELSDDVILYYDKKEVILNSQSLVKAIGKDSYYLSFSRGSKGQHIYLKKMLKLYNVISSNSFRIDIISLTKNIKKYFMGLPNIVRACRDINYLSLNENIIEIKNAFLEVDINPYELIYLKPSKILSTKSFEKIYCFFEDIDNSINGSLNQFKENLINKTKNVFNIPTSTSFKMGLSKFISSHIKENEKPILGDNDWQIENTIINHSNFDDMQVINELAKSCVGSYIEDWETDNSEQMIKTITTFKNNVENANKNDISDKGLKEILDDESELDAMASLLSNNLESAIDEFSGSVSNEDKVKILTRILKKYL